MKTLMKWIMSYLFVLVCAAGGMYSLGEYSLPRLVGTAAILGAFVLSIWVIWVFAVVILSMLGWMRGDSRKAAMILKWIMSYMLAFACVVGWIYSQDELTLAHLVGTSVLLGESMLLIFAIWAVTVVLSWMHDGSKQAAVDAQPSDTKPKGAWFPGKLFRFGQLYLIGAAAMVVIYGRALTFEEASSLFALILVLFVISDLMTIIMLMDPRGDYAVPIYWNIADKVAKAKDVVVSRLPDPLEFPVDYEPVLDGQFDPLDVPVFLHRKDGGDTEI